MPKTKSEPTFFPALAFNDNDRVTYTPMVCPDGRVGYKVERPSGETAYVYLNPSDSSACPTPDVFVYSGPSNDPALDSSECYVAIDDMTFDPEAQG